MEKLKDSDKIIFPDILYYRLEYESSMMLITVHSNTDMTYTQAKQFQKDIAKRNPEGFGGPFKLESEIIDDGTYEIKWECYNIAD